MDRAGREAREGLRLFRELLFDRELFNAQRAGVNVNVGK